MNDDYVENLLSKYGRNKPVRQHIDQSAEKDTGYMSDSEFLQVIGSASYWMSAWKTQCAENERLYEALAASQRREHAAEKCDGCTESGKWEDEVEYGYPSPCTLCKRRCADNWRGPQDAEGEEHDE